MSEAQHQTFVFQVLQLNERKYPFLKWIYAVPNGGHRHPAVAAQMKAQGVKRGIWDICLPFARGGFHGLYIEMKYGKNKLSPEQCAFQEHLTMENFLNVVCRSADEALNAIEGYLTVRLDR